MDPDDNFSPPLGGLSRGKKIHQLLNSLENSDHVTSTVRQGVSESNYDVSAVILLSELADLDEDEVGAGLLLCGWWHMKGEPDWWEYTYLEAGPDGGIQELDESEEGSHVIEITYKCTWARQENDKVEGKTYFEYGEPDEISVEPFDPELDAVKPLTRAIVDTYIPDNIQGRY